MAIRRVHEGLNLAILRPALRAYALGYVSITGPRIFGLLKILHRHNQGRAELLDQLSKTFLDPLAVNRFPTFCGILVGGSTTLQAPVSRLLDIMHRLVSIYCGKTISKLARDRLGRFIAALVSAWLSFRVLNSGKTRRLRRYNQSRNIGDVSSGDVTTGDAKGPREPQPEATNLELAGKTMDLTLFGVVRAIDICGGELWSRRKLRRRAAQKWTRLELMISALTDPALFAASACIVMWAWFYLPERLPRSYNKWIGEAAQVDNRLIEALRRARRGEFVYGKNTGQADLLESMCRDYNWPLQWGDPEKVIPIPCEMVHMGTGPSCEKHALRRFSRAFQFALATYLPLQLVMRMRSPSAQSFLQGLREAARSSAFLGSFISLFYYSVCLARTRLGPKLISHKHVTPMMWDSGLCVASGCMMCGWSVLIEKSRRRQEIAFFVAPRAAATLLPRRYEKKYQIREQIAFALSAAVILTCVQERPERVRGVLGRLLNRVLA